MANEIALSFSLQVNQQNVRFNPGASSITETLLRKSWTTQAIGTSYEQIVIGSDVSTLGIAVFWNRDATNFVDVGLVVSATFYPFLTLKPGERFIMRLKPGVSYYAKADAAGVDLDCLVLND